jgi:GTPase SAR1 family protein
VSALRRAVLAALEHHQVDRAAVVGLPNVGKSSLIVPLTRTQTNQVGGLTLSQRGGAAQRGEELAHCAAYAHTDQPGGWAKMDTKCTTPSQIPTGTGNTVRSFYYARTTVGSQGSSTTVSRSDTTHLTF